MINSVKFETPRIEIINDSKFVLHIFGVSYEGEIVNSSYTIDDETVGYKEYIIFIDDDKIYLDVYEDKTIDFSVESLTDYLKLLNIKSDVTSTSWECECCGFGDYITIKLKNGIKWSIDDHFGYGDVPISWEDFYNDITAN